MVMLLRQNWATNVPGQTQEPTVFFKSGDGYPANLPGTRQRRPQLIAAAMEPASLEVQRLLRHQP